MELVVDGAVRRRRLLLLAAASAAAGYGAYRLYHHPAVARKRQTLARLAGTLDSLSDAAAFSADSAALVSHDLNRYLRFGGEIPLSLRQLAQLASSGEVSASLSRVSQAVTLGVLLGHRRAKPPSNNVQNNQGLVDRILDKLISNDGSQFASSVVGSFARNLILGFYEKRDLKSGSSKPGSENPDLKWVKIVCSEPCKDAITDIVRVFVSTAVAVFLEKTMHLNTFDDIFSGLTNPKHEAKMKEILVSVCNSSIETLVKTSHEVMSKPKAQNNKIIKKNENNKEKNKWVDTFSSTLAEPSNRKFVLDVTGRVTFETVKSFLEFLLWKLLEGSKSGVGKINEEIKEVIKYVSAKSMLVVAICFALCMHVMTGTRSLVPA
ncbi:hypothetical protein LUZ60_005029 [Juncus effusus]|nr:hypothetical protein LUZ60_005029 [Juncus effusus]